MTTLPMGSRDGHLGIPRGGPVLRFLAMDVGDLLKLPRCWCDCRCHAQGMTKASQHVQDIQSLFKTTSLRYRAKHVCEITSQSVISQPITSQHCRS